MISLSLRTENFFTASVAAKQDARIDFVVVDGLWLASKVCSEQYAYDPNAHHRCVVMCVVLVGILPRTPVCLFEFPKFKFQIPALLACTCTHS